MSHLDLAVDHRGTLAIFCLMGWPICRSAGCGVFVDCLNSWSRVRHHALMATFNQQGQNVYGDQNNADMINVNKVDRQVVARELGLALDRVQSMDLDEVTRRQATAELEAAGADLQAGETSRAQERMGRLRAMGGALAEMAGAFLRGTGMLGG
ncbi:hypothetical protein ACF1GY_34985 [Streptomyces sp. NPDC014684]|uniref:hypothetical protein n=1 Tax=Streptomyces sp. NPDC014684 TaxID=3364880 RepID=UPI0036F896B5